MTQMYLSSYSYFNIFIYWDNISILELSDKSAVCYYIILGKLNDIISDI